jgi:hypothetical protein
VETGELDVAHTRYFTNLAPSPAGKGRLHFRNQKDKIEILLSERETKRVITP